jgi:hypothetical protein
MSPLETLANTVNALSIVLAGRNSVHTWWTGILGCAFFASVFFDARLYADMTLGAGLERARAAPLDGASLRDVAVLAVREYAERTAVLVQGAFSHERALCALLGERARITLPLAAAHESAAGNAVRLVSGAG